MYRPRLAKNAEVEADKVADHIRTHLADPALLAKDDFAGFFEARQRALVEATEKATGKAVVAEDGYPTTEPVDEGDD